MREFSMNACKASVAKHLLPPVSFSFDDNLDVDVDVNLDMDLDLDVNLDLDLDVDVNKAPQHSASRHSA